MDEDLLEKAANGDIEARNKIVMDNMRLVYKLAHKYTNVVDLDSLVQEGTIGLIKAAHTFNKNKGCVFSTYAYLIINGAILHFIRDKREDIPVKLFRSDYYLNIKIVKAENELSQKLGRDPSWEELAEHLGVSVEKLCAAKAILNDNISLYSKCAKTGKDKKDCFVVETIEDKNNDLDNGKILNHILISDALSKLSYNEQQVIKLRYFKEKTQSEVAKILGTSQPQASRIEKRALKKIKDFIEKE